MQRDRLRPCSPGMFTLAFISVVVVGLAALVRAQPRNPPEISVWSDAAERRLLYERSLHRNS